MLLQQFGPRAKQSIPSMQTFKDMGVEAGMAAGGQAAGSAMGPYSAVARPVLGAIGGAVGNYMAQRGRVSRGEQEKIMPGQVVGAAMGGATGPGSAMKYAGSNVAATGVQTAMDEGQISADTLGRAAAFGLGGKVLERGLDVAPVDVDEVVAMRKAQDATRQETIKMGKELGYVLPPSLLSKVDDRISMTSGLVESAGGKAAIFQDATQMNQPITNNAVRDEPGMGRFKDLTTESLDEVAQPYNAVYGRVSGLSPQAAVVMREFKQANAAKSELFNAYRNPPMGQTKNPALLEQAKAAQADADFWFSELALEARKAKRPELIDQLNEACVKLAQIALTKNAVKDAVGNIDASVIGDAFEFGEPLTGNFQKVGRFQSAFSQAMREGSATPVSNVGQLSRFIAPFAAGGVAVIDDTNLTATTRLVGFVTYRIVQ